MAARSRGADGGSEAATSDALSALVNLGYDRGEAASAVAAAAGEAWEGDVAALVKAALRRLASEV